MSPDNHLPENDRDLQLARAIEKAGQTGGFPKDIDDPLMPLLLQYREADRAEFRHTSPNSSSVWAGIEAGLQEESTQIYRLLTGSDMVRWIAAAAIVILSLTMLFWLFERSQSQLIASSQNVISTVTLKDGSIVTLRPYSALYEVSNTSTKQVYSVNGEAYFEVANNPNRTFVTETEEGRVSVLGTKFIIQNWNGRTSVFLEEGQIRFETNDQSSSIILDPGEYSSITDNTISHPENSRIFKDWLDNVLVLENQQARLVLSEIEQHFNVSIDARYAPDETLGGSLQLDNLEQVLMDLGVVLGGRFEQTGADQYEFLPAN
jgi:ferric-dicitrate binding protein FerR (iron transport regulator)